MVETYTMFLLELQLMKLSIIHAQLKFLIFFFALSKLFLAIWWRVESQIVAALGEILRCHSYRFGSIEIRKVIKTQVAAYHMFHGMILLC